LGGTRGNTVTIVVKERWHAWAIAAEAAVGLPLLHVEVVIVSLVLQLLLVELLYLLLLYLLLLVVVARRLLKRVMLQCCKRELSLLHLPCSTRYRLPLLLQQLMVLVPLLLLLLQQLLLQLLPASVCHDSARGVVRAGS
jgi:hypothetical protein